MIGYQVSVVIKVTDDDNSTSPVYLGHDLHQIREHSLYKDGSDKKW